MVTAVTTGVIKAESLASQARVTEGALAEATEARFAGKTTESGDVVKDVLSTLVLVDAMAVAETKTAESYGSVSETWGAEATKAWGTVSVAVTAMAETVSAMTETVTVTWAGAAE